MTENISTKKRAQIRKKLSNKFTKDPSKPLPKPPSRKKPPSLNTISNHNNEENTNIDDDDKVPDNDPSIKQLTVNSSPLASLQDHDHGTDSDSDSAESSSNNNTHNKKGGKFSKFNVALPLSQPDECDNSSIEARISVTDNEEIESKEDHDQDSIEDDNNAQSKNVDREYNDDDMRYHKGSVVYHESETDLESNASPRKGGYHKSTMVIHDEEEDQETDNEMINAQHRTLQSVILHAPQPENDVSTDNKSDDSNDSKDDEEENSSSEDDELGSIGLDLAEIEQIAEEMATQQTPSLSYTQPSINMDDLQLRRPSVDADDEDDVDLYGSDDTKDKITKAPAISGHVYSQSVDQFGDTEDQEQKIISTLENKPTEHLIKHNISPNKNDNKLENMKRKITQKRHRETRSLLIASTPTPPPRSPPIKSFGLQSVNEIKVMEHSKPKTNLANAQKLDDNDMKLTEKEKEMIHKTMVRKPGHHQRVGSLPPKKPLPSLNEVNGGPSRSRNRPNGRGRNNNKNKPRIPSRSTSPVNPRNKPRSRSPSPGPLPTRVSSLPATSTPTSNQQSNTNAISPNRQPTAISVDTNGNRPRFQSKSAHNTPLSPTISKSQGDGSPFATIDNEDGAMVIDEGNITPITPVRPAFGNSNSHVPYSKTPHVTRSKPVNDQQSQSRFSYTQAMIKQAQSPLTEQSAVDIPSILSSKSAKLASPSESNMSMNGVISPTAEYDEDGTIAAYDNIQFAHPADDEDSILSPKDNFRKNRNLYQSQPNIGSKANRNAMRHSSGNFLNQQNGNNNKMNRNNNPHQRRNQSQHSNMFKGPKKNNKMNPQNMRKRPNANIMNGKRQNVSFQGFHGMHNGNNKKPMFITPKKKNNNNNGKRVSFNDLNSMHGNNNNMKKKNVSFGGVNGMHPSHPSNRRKQTGDRARINDIKKRMAMKMRNKKMQNGPLPNRGNRGNRGNMGQRPGPNRNLNQKQNRNGNHNQGPRQRPRPRVKMSIDADMKNLISNGGDNSPSNGSGGSITPTPEAKNKPTPKSPPNGKGKVGIHHNRAQSTNEKGLKKSSFGHGMQMNNHLKKRNVKNIVRTDIFATANSMQVNEQKPKYDPVTGKNINTPTPRKFKITPKHQALKKTKSAKNMPKLALAGEDDDDGNETQKSSSESGTDTNSDSGSDSDSGSSSESDSGSTSVSEEEPENKGHKKRKSNFKLISMGRAQSPRYGATRRKGSRGNVRRTPQRSSGGAPPAKDQPPDLDMIEDNIPTPLSKSISRTNSRKGPRSLFGKDASTPTGQQQNGGNGNNNDRNGSSKNLNANLLNQSSASSASSGDDTEGLDDPKNFNIASMQQSKSAFSFGSADINEHSENLRTGAYENQRSQRTKTPQHMPSAMNKINQRKAKLKNGNNQPRRLKTARFSDRNGNPGHNPFAITQQMASNSRSVQNFRNDRNNQRPQPNLGKSLPRGSGQMFAGPDRTRRTKHTSLTYADYKRMRRMEEEKQKENDPSAITWIVGDIIGKGAFGTVYKGYDKKTGKLIAIKEFKFTFKNKKKTLSEFEKETKIMKKLKHANIVEFYKYRVDNNNGLIYLIMEYVPGNSIESIYLNKGAFSEAMIQKYVYQLIVGLNYAHKKNIIHRDIKGKNILIDNRGIVKIADFGSAILSEMDSKNNKNNAYAMDFESTPLWTAPECLNTGQYDSKIDIWSTGCCIIEMATAERPWKECGFNSPFQALFHIGNEDATPEWPKSLSIQCQAFIAKCLIRDPNKRYNTKQLLQHPFLKLASNSSYQTSRMWD